MSHRAAHPLILGAHLSISGGLWRALERAAELRCTAVQIFTHNQVQWRVPRLTDEAAEHFRSTHLALGPFVLAAHASYLLNLASPDRALRERSIRALVSEVKRCAALRIPTLVLHPGAHMGAGEARGLGRIARALERVLRATQGARVFIALENTAGQGSGLGYRFEQIAALFAGVSDPGRLRICFDTAHALAAGYDFRTREGYTAMWDEIERLIGLRNLAIFHLNDSLKTAGSRVDRHTHIGRGEIGREPFAWILADPRFVAVPKVIETPKENEMDRKNLALLRRLARPR